MEMGHGNELEEKPKPTLQFETKDIIFSVVSILIAFFALEMIVQNRGGVWVTLLTGIFCLAVFIYGKSQKLTMKWYHFGFMAFNLLLGISFSLFENKLLLGTNGLFLFMSCMYWVLVLSGSRRTGRLDDQLIFDYLDGFLLRPLKDFSASFSIYQSIGKGNKNLKYMLAGIAVSLPVVLVVVSLLAGADTMFDHFIYQLVGSISENVMENLITFIFAVPIGFYLFLCIYRNMKKSQVRHFALPLLKGPDVLFWTILTIFISIYLLFFGTAIYGYLSFSKGSFAGQSLSDYAREGFFQLLAVALINVLIFGVINMFSSNSKGIKVGLTLIGVETLGLVVLGLAKMKLYIDSFGLTVLRFNTSWFMLLLFVCVCVFIAALWQQFNYLRLIVLLLGSCMLFFSFRNSGKEIINYNYEHYQQGNLSELDVSVFYTLGVAAVPDAVKIYEETDDVYLKEELENYFWMMKAYVEATPGKINLQRSQAMTLIEKTLS
ncbi:DUF4153 domain-containing protein [Enterococcus sp. LJL128]